MLGTNGLSGAVQAGQNGNAQQFINMTGQGVGGVIGGNTGATLQNIGGQVAVTGGQIQNGEYVNMLGTGTGAVASAVGGQAGNNIAFSGN